MRRKLIKIGESTLLLSIPREWVISNNLMKGDELEVEIDEDKLYVWPDVRQRKEKMALDVTEFRDTLPRLLHSLYRTGVDELTLTSKDPGLIDTAKALLWKDAVGFEIMDSGTDFCKIVSVSGKIDDFQTVLRRLFLITLTMGEETASSLKKKTGLDNILHLEQENNRLANMMIRAINKYGSQGFKKIGPLYYIIQELERIGDQYKYISQFFLREKNGITIAPHILKMVESTVLILRKTYELFYTLDQAKTSEIRNMRNKLVDGVLKEYSKKPSAQEIVVLQSCLAIATRSFDMVSSIFILRLSA